MNEGKGEGGSLKSDYVLLEYEAHENMHLTVDKPDSPTRLYLYPMLT